MPDESFTHYITINTADPPGEPITWMAGGDNPGEFSVDSGDGLLDANTDRLTAIILIRYVVVEGQTYAVFRNTINDILFIPYNKADADIAPFFESTPGGTSAYQPAGAQVFNCFATGTTILTPQGERAIETLKPGDRVMTHDGRSTPVIWVARQSSPTRAASNSDAGPCASTPAPSARTCRTDR